MLTCVCVCLCVLINEFVINLKKKIVYKKIIVKLHTNTCFSLKETLFFSKSKTKF